MYLTISTTHQPATDLGYLLYKHPDRVQSFDVSYGQAHVFYPEAGEEKCTAALLLELDPVALVRSSDRNNPAPLAQYVNDRPYVASSFLSSAISEVFGSALSGNCKERPELAEQELPFVATLTAVSAPSEVSIRRLFEPLRYEVEVEGVLLDDAYEEWGESRYFAVTLRASVRLTDLLSHLYVLLPVLDGAKHYWVGRDELEKLFRHGEGWIEDHPSREFIASRYLRRSRSLISEAVDRLALADGELPEDDEPDDAAVETPRKVALHKQRMEAVASRLARVGANSVVDLGCGEGKLIRELLANPQFTRVTGVDVSHRVLELASRRLKLDRMSEARRARVELLHGSLFYRDARLEGHDAVAVVEVIEHLEEGRVASFERVLFGSTRPQWAIVTTPNSDYNVVWESLPAGEFRHDDHRFEWSREEFSQWLARITDVYEYEVEERFGVGDEVDGCGTPTQGVVLRRRAT